MSPTVRMPQSTVYLYMLDLPPLHAFRQLYIELIPPNLRGEGHFALTLVHPTVPSPYTPLLT